MRGAKAIKLDPGYGAAHVVRGSVIGRCLFETALLAAARPSRPPARPRVHLAGGPQ
jgi:hypothetical protein